MNTINDVHHVVSPLGGDVAVCAWKFGNRKHAHIPANAFKPAGWWSVCRHCAPELRLRMRMAALH